MFQTIATRRSDFYGGLLSMNFPWFGLQCKKVYDIILVT